MTTTCPICQELGSTPTCRVCGHDSSKPVMVSDCCGSTYKFVQMYPEGLDICDKCGEWCHPRTGKPVAPTPLSNCHRAEIFHVQAQAFCSSCRNPCEGGEGTAAVPTPNTIYDSVEFLIDRLEHIKFVVENPKSVSGMFGLTETLETLDRELPKIKEKLTTRQLERDLIAMTEVADNLYRNMDILKTFYRHTSSWGMFNMTENMNKFTTLKQEQEKERK